MASIIFYDTGLSAVIGPSVVTKLGNIRGNSRHHFEVQSLKPAKSVRLGSMISQRTINGQLSLSTSQEYPTKVQIINQKVR